jgi:hypothetical protein
MFNAKIYASKSAVASRKVNRSTQQDQTKIKSISKSRMGILLGKKSGPIQTPIDISDS